MGRDQLFAAALTTFLGLALAGCGGSSDDAAVADRPETSPVTGTVTYQGKPVEGATVSFLSTVVPIPGQPTDASSAYGLTDAQGTYRLTTFETDDGAVPGEYKVTITKIQTPPPGAQVSMDDPNYNPDSPAQTAAARPVYLVPERYSDRGTSNLTATVKAGGGNTIPFELKD
jgi:hypothetical protein